MELSVNMSQLESSEGQTEQIPAHETPVKVGMMNDASATLRNRQPRQQENLETNPDSQAAAATVSAEDVVVPYSIWTGLIIFSFFIISFIVIMVLRGVLHGAPLLLKFFANMYLAGFSLLSIF